MELNDLFKSHGIDPKSVIVMRHRPIEPELRKVLPWLAAEHPDTYNAYQQSQGPRLEKSMQRAQYVASFIGHQPSKGLFVGLYKVVNWKEYPRQKFWKMPGAKQLQTFGMLETKREEFLWFNLPLTEFYSAWKGKLVITWPGNERSWWRWAERNTIPIGAIHEQSLLDEKMPSWDELILTWDELPVLPSTWKAVMGQWRGVYYIFDESDGKGYVGSAYGSENILGRWLNYAATGHGGNKLLRQRDCTFFQFSILQRVSPDSEANEVIRLESSWKERLHTREYGLNVN
ncbi:hypothetical protein Mal52_30180 [Symmachiella dynata]|uniref:GIY-YIG domain-containing protein n=1 Tax=Symmachiella dynata TaxID=2527995 RepID=A0A517ZPX2_9PLAN|nr:GIY-YIG nuclease family protein [Symmachiella dynata]QDU44535.1 hypothetical protein Mal52_30180 [Symmachiella dynata]